MRVVGIVSCCSVLSLVSPSPGITITAYSLIAITLISGWRVCCVENIRNIITVRTTVIIWLTKWIRVFSRRRVGNAVACGSWLTFIYSLIVFSQRRVGNAVACGSWLPFIHSMIVFSQRRVGAAVACGSWLPFIHSPIVFSQRRVGAAVACGRLLPFIHSLIASIVVRRVEVPAVSIFQEITICIIPTR